MIRLLLIDSHPLLGESLLRTLDSLDLPALQLAGRVSTVAAAEAWFESGDADLLVLGIGQAEAVASVADLLRDARDRRVLVVTRHQAPELLAAIRAAGALGVLGTGSTAGDLRRACVRVAEGESFVAPSPSGHSTAGTSVLTRREAEVLRCVAEGGTTKSIGQILEISAKTVDSHRQNIMRKLDLRSVAELTKYAVRVGITGL